MGKKQQGKRGERRQAGQARRGWQERNWELRRGPRKDGSGEEPTREGGRSEPVERRGPEAAALPHALQPGVVCCPPPPPPQGSRQEGDSRREGRHPTNGTGDKADTGHTEDTWHEAFNRTKQNKNKEKKSRLVRRSGSGVWSHTGGKWEGL